MNIKKILLSVLVCLVIAAVISIVLINSYKKDLQPLELAQSLLYENKINEAKLLFSRLEESSWIKKHARLGSIITAILCDTDYKDIPLPEKDIIKIDDFHLHSLLRRQLASSAFNRCIRLANIGQFYELEAADLYYSAALLEKGKTRQAFDGYVSLSDRVKKTFPGKRLKETFVLRPFFKRTRMPFCSICKMSCSGIGFLVISLIRRINAIKHQYSYSK